MIKMMEDRKIIYESDGAMVVDVQEPIDNNTINPCMILKRGGVSCYQTTDLATLLQRKKEFNPDEVIYVVDKRQEMHFVQVFRCAKKADLVNSDTVLTFLGFGTINGKDGKPFKTRDGGVMRLEKLIEEVNKKIFAEWLPNCIDYEIAAGYNIEMYSDPSEYEKGNFDENYYCEVWIPVKKK